MPPRRAARSVSRRDTPVSPPKASPSAVSLDQNKRTARSASRDITDAQVRLLSTDRVLAPVNEDPEAEHPGDDYNHVSAAIPSSSAGSHLRSEMEELDRGAIIERLIGLYQDSSSLLSHFDKPDKNLMFELCENLIRPNSSERRRFEMKEKRLLSSKKPYGELDFINTGLIVRRLAGTADLDAINQGPWRPDPVIYLANLALQLAAVFSCTEDVRKTYLQYMFNNFPRPFADDTAFPFGAHMIEETTVMNVELLTQIFIQRVEADQHLAHFDPNMLAEQVFWNEDGQLRAFGESQSGKSHSVNRVRMIRSHFLAPAQDSVPVNVEALKIEFPWFNFLVALMKWSVARKKELEDAINSNGGIDSIVDLLLSEKLEENPQPNVVPGEDEAEPHNNVSVPSTDPTDLQRLRAMRKGPLTGKPLRATQKRLHELKADHAARLSAQGADQAVDHGRANVDEIPQSPVTVGNDESEPADDKEVAEQHLDQSKLSADEDELIPTQHTVTVMETLSRQQKQSNKENRNEMGKKKSFLDPQPGAHREPIDDSDMESITDKHTSKRQRRRADESDEDPEFETDTRPAKKSRVEPAGEGDANFTDNDDTPGPSKHARRKRGRPRESADRQASNPPRQPRVREGPSSSSHPGRSMASQSSRPPLRDLPADRVLASAAPTTSRARQSATISPPRSSTQRSPPRSQVARANHEAKRFTRMFLETNRRPTVQVRRAYTESEVDRLLEMVALFGTSWSRILEEDSIHEDGPLLQGRSQIQLKDKARNIKLDFLKARRRLPEGFERVSIGARQIENLRQLGINYIEGRYGPEGAVNEDEDEDEHDD